MAVGLLEIEMFCVSIDNILPSVGKVFNYESCMLRVRRPVPSNHKKEQILGKLTAACLAKKFDAFYGNVPPAHTIPSCLYNNFTRIYSYVLLHISAPKPCRNFSFTSYVPHALYIRPWLHQTSNIWRAAQIMKLLITQFSSILLLRAYQCAIMV